MDCESNERATPVVCSEAAIEDAGALDFARAARDMEERGRIRSGRDCGELRPVMLVASFGTSYNENRADTIGAIECAVANAFPQFEVRRAFTAREIVEKLFQRDGYRVDTVEQALARCANDGVREVYVLPTHLIPGREYADVRHAVDKFVGRFDVLKMAGPLLDTSDDIDRVIGACVEAMSSSGSEGETALCLMGHGTNVAANQVYFTVRDAFALKSPLRHFIGTVEGTPTLEDAVDEMVAAGVRRAVLRPLMVVAGDHANNDMADADDPESLAGMLSRRGVEVECQIEGLGQLLAIRALYVQHARSIVEG